MAVTSLSNISFQDFVAPKVSSANLLKGSRIEYLNALEKHLSDYQSGNGNLPSPAPSEIFRQSVASSTFFATTDPRTAKALSGYLTALPYTERARFLNGVDSTNEAVGRFAKSVNLTV